MRHDISSEAEGATVDARGARRLRVARVYFHLEVGGIEKRLVDLLPRLDRSRFDLQLVCTRRRGALADELENAGVPVRVCRHHRKLPTVLSALKLARLFRRLDVDLVHGHGEAPAQIATLAARWAGTPLVVANFHNVGLFRERGQLRRERRQAPQRDAVIHVSRRVREDYEERVRPGAYQARVIYNGVDVQRFAAAPDAARLDGLRAELQLGDGAPLLLKVARLRRNKAHHDLFDAFREVLGQHPRALLLLAGDGHERGWVERGIRERGLQSSVRLLGRRGDVHDLYHLVDVNVVASHREGFSNVVLEAMAAGTPQVVTDVGGNSEAVGESGAARVVPARDPAALARELLRLLGDRELSASMRGAARQRAACFSVEEQVLRTEQLYLELARRKGLAAARD